MSRRGRWDRLRDRDRMRKHGTEGASASAPLFSRTTQLVLDLGTPPRRRHTPSKSELRALGEAALRTWRARRR
jgi:hypothetical protein